MIEWLLEQYETWKWAIAGVFGALVSGLLQKQVLVTWKDWGMFLLRGAIIAHFLTGLIASYFEVISENATGLAFLVGCFGCFGIQAISKYILTGELWALLRARFGCSTSTFWRVL